MGGIGSTTIQRFTFRFAVYPNILTAADGDFDGLMPGWSHHPNLGRVDEIVAAVDEHYRAIMEEDGWPDPEQFENYPSGNPIYDRPV